MKFTLGIIGAGVMANAIIDRAIEKKVISNKDIIVYDISDDTIKLMIKKGYRVAHTPQELFDKSENVLLSVKPQHYADVLNNNSLLKTACLISIMAGVKIDTLRKSIDNKNIAIARVMPNTPCKIGKGFSGICYDNVNKSTKSLIENIFSSCGETLNIPEDKFDALTSISGSGPAYIYSFLNGMIKGGINGGLDYDQAKKMAVATMKGASELALISDESMDELINKVCSKGGTTIEAIEYFRKNNLETIISQGIDKCRKKSKELSETL